MGRTSFVVFDELQLQLYKFTMGYPYFSFLKLNVLNTLCVTTRILGVREHNCEFVHLFYNEPFVRVHDNYKDFLLMMHVMCRNV
jgi:hypothetical protein